MAIPKSQTIPLRENGKDQILPKQEKLQTMMKRNFLIPRGRERLFDIANWSDISE